MNPLAIELNETIHQATPHVFEMLSMLGRRLYFPRGIVSQGAEAKKLAHRYNATVGIATEGGGAMHLQCIADEMPGIAPADAFPYAPSWGKPELREAWRQWQLKCNPSMSTSHCSLPVVTNALTHAMTLAGELFLDPGDKVLVPDKFWGNYRLMYEVRLGAEIVTYNTFTPAGGFDVAAFTEALEQVAGDEGEVFVILNFPNNPSGYTVTDSEAEALAETLVRVASQGIDIVAVCDDAYFGLFYDDACAQESLFCRLANRDPRLLAIKVDGATKEMFVWGFRVGFITFAAGGVDADSAAPMYEALEKKVSGAIRGSISNCPHPSQSAILAALQHPDFERQRAEKVETLRQRAMKVHEVLESGDFSDAWEPYPFNSGYFMCLRLKDVEAEPLRVHLLKEYGVGTISASDTDLRIAFSCLEEDQIEDLFALVHQGVRDLKE